MPKFPVLSREDVQKELKLNDDQIAKINEQLADIVKDGPNGSKVMTITGGQDLDSIEKEIDKILNAKQHTRYKEVWLQISGTRTFMRDDIAKEVDLKKDQREKISELQQEMMSKMREMAFTPGTPVSEESLEEIKKLQKELEGKIEKLLTKEQQTKWTTMKGAKFEMKAPKKTSGAK